MKTLIYNDRTFPIFKGTDEQIKTWVESNLMEFDFINESFSCNVHLEKFEGDNSEIYILGDEDFHTLQIQHVEIIRL